MYGIHLKHCNYNLLKVQFIQILAKTKIFNNLALQLHKPISRYLVSIFPLAVSTFICDNYQGMSCFDYLYNIYALSYISILIFSASVSSTSYELIDKSIIYCDDQHNDYYQCFTNCLLTLLMTIDYQMIDQSLSTIQVTYFV